MSNWLRKPMQKISTSFAVRIGAADVSAGSKLVLGMTAGVPHAWQKMIFAPRDHARFFVIGGQVGVVAVGEVDRFAVGAEDERMRAVFAGAVHLAEEFDLLELIVAVGIAHPPEARASTALVDHHVEAVECVEQAVRADLDLGFFAALFLDSPSSGRGRSGTRVALKSMSSRSILASAAEPIGGGVMR